MPAALQGAPHVVDVRCCGLLAPVELALHGGVRGAGVAPRCLHDGELIRASGGTLLLSPPLMVSESQIAEAAAAMAGAPRAIA